MHGSRTLLREWQVVQRKLVSGDYIVFVKDGTELLRVLEEFSPTPTDYFRHGADRIAASINFLPREAGTVLELGCDSHFTLAMSQLTSFTILPQNSPSPIAAPENVEDPTITFTRKDKTSVQFERQLFDVEAGTYPLHSESVDGVLCCELIEHLFRDPAWMLHEANRVLKPGGWLLLTTPNLTSYHAIRRAAQGIHPLEHSLYFHGDKYPGLPIQHTREYAFWEIVQLLRVTGFRIERKETYTFTRPERLGFLDYLVLIPAITLYNVLHRRHPKHMRLKFRRPHTFVLARKEGKPESRYPEGIYLQ